MTAPVIGIDLGTTFSCAAVYREGKGLELIHDSYGESIFPSVVYFDPKTGNALVGKNAVDEIPECQINGIFDAKRIIGRKFDDEHVSYFINNNDVPFSIVRGENDQAAFQVTISGNSVIKTPEEVSAEVLKYIKTAAKECLGCEVTEAVISVPARFSNAQRKATKKAAELAGLIVLKLITEPTAAAMHYVRDKEKNNKNVMVFDFGGGTLDVSIIEINDKKFKVKAVYGDTFLGGRDIDEMLFNHFRKAFVENRAVSQARKKTFLRRLRAGCVELKKKLSAIDEAKYPIESCYGGDEGICLKMSRSEFEILTLEISERAFGIVRHAINDVGIPEKDIHEVVLAGGTTRIPMIRNKLNSYFNSDKVKTDLHPDHAVAAGASLQAALLKHSCGELEKYEIMEVTPLSLGTELKGGLMKKLIHRNTALPCKVTHKTETCVNDQDCVRTKVFEGERANTAYNNFLGEFTISGLPRKRAGDVEIIKDFELDEDGILSISAREETTGVSNKFAVSVGQFRLSERRVKISIEEARKHKLEDSTFAKFIRCRNKLQKNVYHILYDLEKIPSSTDVLFVGNKCYDFLESSNKLNFTEIEKLEAEFTVFQNSVSEILKNNSMLQIRE